MNNDSRVFLSYTEEDREFVEAIAVKLRGDARLSFWFAPWHAVPGLPLQEQTEEALSQSQACIVFIGGTEGQVKGWQNEEVRVAIQTRVESRRTYRVVPVFVPSESSISLHNLPPFLRRYVRRGTEIVFNSPNDAQSFRHLLAGILGIPPITVHDFLNPTPQIQLEGAVNLFTRGKALLIGIADYPRVRHLPDAVLNDARDLHALLTDSKVCGYQTENVHLILNQAATRNRIRSALRNLAVHTTSEDTVVVFFSGHGTYDVAEEYILPYDCNPSDLANTAISGAEMTNLLNNIKAARLLVVFDSCHSGGAGDPKTLEWPNSKAGLSEHYYQSLAQGKGRVVMASCRADEVSWVLPGSRNSLFTKYFLSALGGKGKTLGDGYIRVFDVFRHVVEHVPTYANQHPIFKSAMEEDFPIALDTQQLITE
jgi:hypothetical protein